MAAASAAALAAIVLRASVAELARVSSSSMAPTLQPGDRILVDKRAYGFRLPLSRWRLGGRPPRRGDVIVFRATDSGGAAGDLLKRVIGLPGDRITMIDTLPVINGQRLPTCDAGTFVYFTASRFTRGRLLVERLEGQVYLTVHEPGPGLSTSYEVPPGEVFVVGDNRGSSNDSRSWNEGRSRGVPLTAIAGRVHRVLFGTDRRGTLQWDRVWAGLGTQVYLPGVDVTALRAEVERCLSELR